LMFLSCIFFPAAAGDTSGLAAAWGIERTRRYLPNRHSHCWHLASWRRSWHRYCQPEPPLQEGPVSYSRFNDLRACNAPPPPRATPPPVVVAAAAATAPTQSLLLSFGLERLLLLL
jgi:hypothetical protein